MDSGKRLLLRLRCGQRELLTCPTEALDGGTARWNEEFVFDSDGVEAQQEEPVRTSGLEVEVWMWGEGIGPGDTGCPGPAGSQQIGNGFLGASDFLQPLSFEGPALGVPLQLFAPRGRHPSANVRVTDKRVHVQTEDAAGQIRLLTAYADRGARYEFCPAGCGAALPAVLIRLHLLLCPSALVSLWETC